MSTLREHQNTDVNSYMKHANIKDYYIYNILSLLESHKGKVRGLYVMNKKKQISFIPEEKECCTIASLSEDGQVIV